MVVQLISSQLLELVPLSLRLLVLATHSQTVATVLEIGEHPLITLLAPEGFLLEDVELFAWDEVLEDQVFQFELFLQYSSSILELVDLSYVHFFEFFVFCFDLLS